MKKANIAKAKNELSSLLAEVQQGQSVLICDRGRPVAVLSPVQPWLKQSGSAQLESLERKGLLKRAQGRLASTFYKAPRPAAKNSDVLSILLEERNAGR